MSEIIYESLERVTKRKIYLLDEHHKDRDVKTKFMGSKYIGQEIIVCGVVKGSDYEDAKAGINDLEDECKNREEKTILNITGKIVEFRTSLKISSTYQPFTITLATY
jgi:hypothetical protein